MSYLDDYPNLRPDPTKCGNKANHLPLLADFPCVLDPSHTEPHEDKFGRQWKLDGGWIRKEPAGET